MKEKRNGCNKEKGKKERDGGTKTKYKKITIPIFVVIITADILGLIIRTIPHIIVSTEVITDKTK